MEQKQYLCIDTMELWSGLSKIGPGLLSSSDNSENRTKIAVFAKKKSWCR